MRDAHQMDEGFGRRDPLAASGCIESVTDDLPASRREIVFRTGTHQRADGVTSLQQRLNQGPADISCAAGDEYTHSALLYSSLISRRKSFIRSLRSWVASWIWLVS
jgi:hypothetical protein